MFGGFKIQQCIEMSPTSPGEDSDFSNTEAKNVTVVTKRKMINCLLILSRLAKRQIPTLIQITEVRKRHSRGAFKYDFCVYLPNL